MSESDKKVSDHFEVVSDFSEILDDAEAEAYSDADVEFVEDMIQKHTDYGTEMFLSDLQLARLRKIAYGEEDSDRD